MGLNCCRNSVRLFFSKHRRETPGKSFLGFSPSVLAGWDWWTGAGLAPAYWSCVSLSVFEGLAEEVTGP